MVFSSLIFLSIFLPAALLGCRMMPSVRAQNGFLLVLSLLFYAYGEPVYVFWMIASAAGNYVWAILIDWYPRHKRGILWVAVLQNLLVLGIFKYAGFLAELWNRLGIVPVPVPHIKLPIGISFFTFQAMSYVIDVYRGETEPQKNVLRLLLYISFFPQLIAGPIVNYHDIEQELQNRVVTAKGTAEGLRRFILGLGKKVLIANYMAVVADTLFEAPSAEINMAAAWVGALSYLLQIYYDFSGYSDMAIGLGWMFGFHFKENFRQPYRARNVQEFWRRWHISLSTWFREYLYIPLGGNRKGRLRAVINRWIVFACTGIWHGANLTFLFWGLYHGLFLTLEEYLPFLRREGKRGARLLQHTYLILVVMIGFVLFRSESLGQAVLWIGRMFLPKTSSLAAGRLCLSVLTPLNCTAAAVGILGVALDGKRLGEKLPLERLMWILTPCILVLCMMCLAGGTYNPFIYFRF